MTKTGMPRDARSEGDAGLMERRGIVAWLLVALVSLGVGMSGGLAQADEFVCVGKVTEDGRAHVRPGPGTDDDVTLTL